MQTVTFHLDGRDVTVSAPPTATLLDTLRGQLGVTTAKDGCSPQGQCGCCTVLVDGEPRVACVTPLRRVEGRAVTTFDGLGDQERDRWAAALCSAGGSQCGFCTPGIVVRLEWLRRRGSLDDGDAVDRSLAAHLCRCTGWSTIREAARAVAATPVAIEVERDLDAASRRATVEGHAPQAVGLHVAAGRAGFADDTVPEGALVALVGRDGEWVVGDDLPSAREASGKVQGRRTTAVAEPPLALPDGDWDVVLRTGWVEPAYLEADVAWCEPGGAPSTSLANGGAFGGKVDSPLGRAARELADRHDRPVVARWSREDVVRRGPKRPPIAAGVRADGTGVIRVVRTPGIAERISSVAPGLSVEEVDVAGPPTSSALRAAGWAEAAVLLGAAAGDGSVTSPDGAEATVDVAADGSRVSVRVRCGEVLDEVVLRSYCIGAVHMALGWVTSEGLAVGEDGTVADLTIRSYGILRPADMPEVVVEVVGDDGPAVCGSDAVFAATALAVWRHQGLPAAWPSGVALRP
jgi:aerobic-type carbon monoxide dehydrogenase small subunit (CoxS/CutS family)